MRRNSFLPLSLVLALLLTLFPAARAADSVTPTPPDWVPAEEYAVFEGSTAYEGETWDTILQLRAHAEAGNPAPQSGTDTVLYNRRRALAYSHDPGVRFELGLLSLRFAVNAASRGQTEKIGSDFEMAAHYAPGQEPGRYLAYLWNARANLWDQDVTGGLEGKGLSFIVGALSYLLDYPQFTMSALLDCPLLAELPQEKRDVAENLLLVTLDGDVVHPRAVRYDTNYVDTSTAQTRNDRTMVPVRRLAELMGATVDYDASTGQVTITRAGDTIVMTLGETTALQNGVPLQMDAAPYAENSRTYIPIRYIAEFFGQKVEWLPEKRQVAITEDKSVAGDSNLEAWALGMGAVLSAENHSGDTALFGGKRRFGTAPVGSAVTNALETTGPDFARQSFRNGWPIDSRETLTGTIGGLLDSPGAYPAWDLFRISSLAQWGYLAGYVTYAEALELVEPAARLLCEDFSSWDDAYEDYLNGYTRWAGSYQPDQDVWQTERGLVYQQLKADPATAPIFDDTLFQTGIIGLPE